MPVMPPCFQADTFEAQVDEIVKQLTPSQACDRVARELAGQARAVLVRSGAMREVEVVGIANGDIVRGTAFGVAVPELDLVATAPPHALLQQLQGRITKGGLCAAKLDPRKLQKSAIRMCTDQLVSIGGFKFRRSAFRGQEPKVTLMAPPTLGLSGKGIPVDFSVNCSTPLYNAALLREACAIDPRTRSLILLVRRWAKDRGVCHAAKGHLPPYAWTLMTIYFLQVAFTDDDQGGPLLPPMQGFKMASGPAVRRGGEADEKRGRARWQPPAEGSASAAMSVAALFKEFVRFYAESMDWRCEAVSVRLGRRASANLHLTLHIVVHEDRSTEAGPSIEDPFEPSRNLGSSLTALGLGRLREELARARGLMEKGASLSSLLEPWAPPERAPVTAAAAASIAFGGGSYCGDGESEVSDGEATTPRSRSHRSGSGGSAAPSAKC